MNYAADNGEDFGAAFAFFTIGWILFLLFVWSICALVAGFIASDRQRSFWLFFVTTFFFLGPIGVGFALIAPRGEMDRLPPAPVPAKRPIADGRQRFTCPRCGAESDLPNADTSYECWRCGEVRKVKPRVTA
jgi:DNA-directed RNA polymerase subunit RPC12/RpoP